MKLSTVVLPVAAALVVFAATPALAEICESRRGPLVVAEECPANAGAADHIRLCRSERGRLHLRSACTGKLSLATAADGKLCASRTGRVTQRNRCRTSEKRISSVSACVARSGRLSPRDGCRRGSMSLTQLALPARTPVDPDASTQDDDWTPGRRPAMARVVFEEPGVIQVIEGFRCESKELGGFSLGLPDFDVDRVVRICPDRDTPQGRWCEEVRRGSLIVERDEWELPGYADQATVFSNGWKVRYANGSAYSSGDHHVNGIEVLISPYLEQGRLLWDTAMSFGDKGFDDSFLACSYYTAVAWNEDEIDARPIHTAYTYENLHGVSDYDGSGPRTTRYTYTGTERPDSGEVVVVPRGFFVGFPKGVDHHLLQIAHRLKPEAEVPNDGGLLRWEATSILRDNQSRFVWAGSHMSLIGGRDVDWTYGQWEFDEIEEARPVCDGLFDTCWTHGAHEREVREVVVSQIPEFDYAIPLLTGFDLRFASEDEHVKTMGAWIEQSSWDPDTKRLSYQVGSILQKESGGSFRAKHNVLILGFRRTVTTPQNPIDTSDDDDQIVDTGTPTRDAPCTLDLVGRTCGPAADVTAGNGGICRKTLSKVAACTRFRGSDGNVCYRDSECAPNHACIDHPAIPNNPFLKTVGYCLRRIL